VAAKLVIDLDPWRRLEHGLSAPDGQAADAAEVDSLQKCEQPTLCSGQVVLGNGRFTMVRPHGGSSASIFKAAHGQALAGPSANDSRKEGALG
jgi:hypothetical protein